MDKKLIIANWKMNVGPQDGHDFFHKLESKVATTILDVDFAIAASFVTLPFMLGHLHEEDNEDDFYLPLAAQNFHSSKKGKNVTGEVSLEMIDQLGVDYVLIGHSERRKLFHETDKDINEKLLEVIPSEIIPVVIFGEMEKLSLEESKQYVQNQLKVLLNDVDEEELINIIFVYEPSWAIASKASNVDFAQEMISFSRECLAKMYHDDIAEEVIFLYGGSINSDNISSFMEQKDINGLLVGQASLEFDSFWKLLTYNSKK